MKTWEMTVKIESSTDMDLNDMIRKIDQDINRGDGLWLDLKNAKISLKAITKIKPKRSCAECRMWGVIPYHKPECFLGNGNKPCRKYKKQI